MRAMIVVVVLVLAGCIDGAEPSILPVQLPDGIEATVWGIGEPSCQGKAESPGGDWLVWGCFVDGTCECQTAGGARAQFGGRLCQLDVGDATVEARRACRW